MDKTKSVNIEKELFPNNSILKENEDGKIITRIVDVVFNEIKCSFNYDGCVQINTAGLKHIVLSKENLDKLINLIDEAEMMYENKKEE